MVTKGGDGFRSQRTAEQSNGSRSVYVSDTCDCSQVAQATDNVRLQLLEIKQSGTHADKKALDNLKKRKLTTPKKLIYFSVSKGSNYSRTIQKLETDLTVEMLQR